MCRPGTLRRAAARLARLAPPLCVALAAGFGSAQALAQVAEAPEAAPAVAPAPEMPVIVPSPDDPMLAPGGILEGIPAVTAVAPALPPEIQVVRFTVPEGVVLEVLAPVPEAVPPGDGRGAATVGLRVGVAYRLRLSNLPNRPGQELYPVVEMVGHLHRPPGVDPGRFPIRVPFEIEDVVEADERGRLVTQVVYLEDPEQALPLDTNKDEIPTVSVTPAEDPLRVARALGRVMAIVKMGGRRPSPEELNREIVGVAAEGLGMPCPFVGPSGHRCGLPCGPVVGTPPPPGRPWIPSDEYLCDGGDRGEAAHFGGEGGLRGIDPRDAVIRFRGARYDDIAPEIEVLRAQYERGEITFEQFRIRADRLVRSTERAEPRPRILPTNMVCVYAPRFAAVRASVGPDAAVRIEAIDQARVTQRQEQAEARALARRLAQRQAAEIGRHRSRASGLGGRVYAGETSELRVLGGYETTANVAGNVLVQSAERREGRQKLAAEQFNAFPGKLERQQNVAVRGIVEGAGQTVMTWTPRETVGVEVPPNRPGLAIIKRVDAEAAEPGDTLTYTIQYRNMGNTPISSVSVVDSLMPRLRYLTGTAQGPKGTVFSSTVNTAGSTELRWDLPGVIAPGAEGYVSFQAAVR